MIWKAFHKYCLNYVEILKRIDWNKIRFGMLDIRDRPFDRGVFRLATLSPNFGSAKRLWSLKISLLKLYSLRIGLMVEQLKAKTAKHPKGKPLNVMCFFLIRRLCASCEAKWIQNRARVEPPAKITSKTILRFSKIAGYLKSFWVLFIFSYIIYYKFLRERERFWS